MTVKQNEVHLESLGIEWPRSSINPRFPTIKLEVRPHELAIIAINKEDGNVFATVLDVPFDSEALGEITHHIRAKIGQGKDLNIHLFGLGLHGSHVNENDLGEDSLSDEFLRSYLEEIEDTKQNARDGLEPVAELRKMAPETLGQLSPESIKEHYIETNERQTVTLFTRTSTARIKKSFEPDGVETETGQSGDIHHGDDFGDLRPRYYHDDPDFD